MKNHVRSYTAAPPRGVFKRLLLMLCIGCTSGLCAQYRESTNLIEKLLWDDNMLHIMADTRIDARAGTADGSLNTLGFHGQTIKIWLVGEIIPGIRYRIRHRLNKLQTPLHEGYSGATDHAFLVFDLGERWTITAGKQSMQFGTFEYDYSAADIYLGTMVFSDLNSYRTGIDAAYKFSGQTLHLQVVNSDDAQFADADYAARALGAAAMWEGSLFSQALRTRWGYGLFQHTDTRFYHWLTLGTQLNFRSFTAELDYYLGERDMDYSAAAAAPGLGSRFVRDQSAAINLRYTAGSWHPSIKAVWNQRHDNGFKNNAYQIMGIQAAVEYYPFTHPWVKDLRFHLMYSFSSTDFQGNFAHLPSQKSSTILFGTRWLFKVK